MLRADVKEHEVRVVALPAHAPLLGAELECLLLGVLLLERQLVRTYFRGASRVLLAQRMTCPAFGMRIRSRCGCPSKAIPNMSHTSRSYQFAAGQMWVMVGSESDLQPTLP